MTTPSRLLTDIYSEEEISDMMRSWLAYSASNIIVYHDMDKGCDMLLLGDRAKSPESIPENGRWCLIGGFNTFPGLNMWHDIADAHIQAMLGIEVESKQYSGFLPCEYDMAEITEPLNTPFGGLNIKRVAFDRIVELTEEQVEQIQPQGKISAIRWVTTEEFEEMTEIKGSEGLSFPHQIDHVRQAMEIFSYGELIDKLNGTPAIWQE